MISRNLRFKIISILIGLILGLLLIEIGLRLMKYYTFQNLDEIEFGNRLPINQPDKELTLGQIIQISPYKEIIYELIPNSIYSFKNAIVKTNNEGFKDKNYPINKSNDTKRIIGIGDSGMFGWGVREEECYLTRLEDQLNKNDSLQFEIINTSVPGYNTVMEVAVLEKKIQLEDVDLVIIDFISNDFELPSFIRKKPNFLTIKKSFLLIFLEEEFFGVRDKLDKWLSSSPIDEDGYFESRVTKVPEEYRNHVGKENYISAMKKLKTLSDKFKFEVLVLSQSPFLKIPEIVTNTCAELEFEFVDFAPYWEEYKIKNPNAKWKLSEHDWHPRPEGHKEIANVLFQKISEMKLYY